MAVTVKFKKSGNPVAWPIDTRGWRVSSEHPEAMRMLSAVSCWLLRNKMRLFILTNLPHVNVHVCIPTSSLSLLYLEDMMTSCGNRTSRWLRHLTFPLLLLTPPPPTIFLSLSFLLVCVRSLWVCVIRVEVRDSLLPIVLSFLPHSHSASCGASCYEAERNGGKKRAGKRRNDVRGWRKSDLSTEVGKNYWNSTVGTIMCVDLCSHGEFPAGTSLSAVHCAGKGVSFVFWCLRVWRWRVMLLWFYKCAQNECQCFVGQNLFASLYYSARTLTFYWCTVM